MKITLDLLSDLRACNDGQVRFVELWGENGAPELSEVVARLLPVAFGSHSFIGHTTDGLYLRWLLLTLAGPQFVDALALLSRHLGCDTKWMEENFYVANLADCTDFLWLRTVDLVNVYMEERGCSSAAIGVVSDLYKDLAALIEKKGN